MRQWLSNLALAGVPHPRPALAESAIKKVNVAPLEVGSETIVAQRPSKTQLERGQGDQTVA